MPRKTKTSAAAQKAALPQIPADFLEQLIPGPVTPAQFEDILSLTAVMEPRMFGVMEPVTGG